MNVPPWQPPNARPAPFEPARPAVSAVGPALLRAPLWNPQEGETAAEHAAFLAWLMGGYEYTAPRGRPAASGKRDTQITTRGDWAAALGVLGGTSSQVQALAHKWSWEVRGREYWTATRAVGERAAEAHEAGVLEFAALARELDRKWLELEILEVDKATITARRITPQAGEENDDRFLPAFFTPRELIALRRAAGALEVQRHRAGILERIKHEGSNDQTDWALLPPADLETYRQLRERARVQ